MFQAIDTEKEFTASLGSTFSDNDTIYFTEPLDVRIQQGMVIRTSGTIDGRRRTAEIQSIRGDLMSAVVRYWIGGAPTTGYPVDLGVGDLFEIQSRFRTKDTFWLRPTPSITDEEVARMKMLFIPLPLKPDTYDDPIEIDFRYSSPLSACLYWQCAERQGSYSQSELAGYKADYMIRKDDVRPVSTTPTGQRLTVRPGGIGRTRDDGGFYDVDQWDSSGIRRIG